MHGTLQEVHPEPTLGAPELDAEVIPPVQVVAAMVGPHHPPLEPEGQGHRILDFHRLAAHVPGDGGNLLDAVAGEVLHQVQIVDPQPDELASSGLVLERQPRLLVPGPGQAGLVGDEDQVGSEGFAQESGPDQFPGLENRRVKPRPQGQHQVQIH